jgi:hypothetical protein
LGDGSSPLSLSRTDVRHPVSKVTGFPTPFSTASGVAFGLIAGPLILVARRSILSEASWLASATPNGFGAACEPGQDTLVTAVSRLDHFALGRPPLLTVRWPSATGLTSYLSGCFSLTSQRCIFKHRRRFRRFQRPCLGRVVLPDSFAHFVPPFGVFHLADEAFNLQRQSRSNRADAQ